MKMSLSVVMGVIDKATAPLKKMSEETNRYGEEMKKVEKAQAEDSASMGMIDTYNKSLNALRKYNIAVAAASEKLDELKRAAKAAQTPNAALTEKIAKQQDKLSKLTGEQSDYRNDLKKLGRQLKKNGINTKQLDNEYDRLNQSYKNHGKEITKLQKKYVGLQKVMKIPRGINKALKMPTVEGVKNGALATTGVLGSMAGFGIIINDTANELDELQRAADDINMPVAELQAMRLQATQSGAEAEDMDAAIKEMALRWGEMKTFQSGAMNDYFKDTGNHQAYEDLMNAKDAGEAYQVLLREIAKETDTAKQNFMADEFFGGDSEKMLNVLRGGVEGYRQAKQLLNDTGGPVEPESTKNAQAFSESLGKLNTIVNSLKISALTPIMAELSFIMEDLALNMKDMDWREEKIAELREIVKSAFNAFRTLGSGVLWLSDNMSTVIGVLAGVKLALIGVNAIALANPFGQIIIAIGAVIAIAGYLIDKLGGISAIVSKMKAYFSENSIFEILFDISPLGIFINGIDMLLEKFGGFSDIVEKIKSTWNSFWGEDEEVKENPDKATPQKTHAQGYQLAQPSTYQSYNPYVIDTKVKGTEKVKAQAKQMKELQSRNVELGVTTTDITNTQINKEQAERSITEQNDTANSVTNEQLQQSYVVDHQVHGQEKIKAQAKQMKELQNRNVELGVTTTDITNTLINKEQVERSITEQSDTASSVTNEQLKQSYVVDHQVHGQEKIKAQAKQMKELQNRNIELGLNTNEVTSQTKKSYEEQYYSAIYQGDEPPTIQPYNPYIIKTQINGADKVQAQAKLMKEMQNRNIELGITTNETVNQSVNSQKQDVWDTSTDYAPSDSSQINKQSRQNEKYQPLGHSSLSGGYQPLTAQTVNNKSEIDLRIQSDKPVVVEKAKVDKGIDLNLDVGDMSWSY
ncbi:hypothetical protein [Vibrio jasicida]|uniref:hypothetical protein n=1 Tax=Vibrio jasicida TaxID=766224 RepID=UPI0006932B80|nr:hypothetical protein [Vibrio jasicida]